MEHVIPAQAQETAYPDPSGEKQCSADDINDSNAVVGSCIPANATNPSVAWYAATRGTTPTLLQPLATGQDCNADALADQGTIVGSCTDANNRSFGVIWNTPTSAPVKLAPLPILSGLNLAPDVATGATGYNLSGDVVGESASGSGVATAVLWPAMTGTPIIVSSYGDNCSAVDVNGTNEGPSGAGHPSVALNCPTSTGLVQGKLAQYTAGLLGYAYTATTLPLPTGATHCTVAALNDALQAVGTCHFPAPDHPQTAYWPSPTSTPNLLTVSGNARNGADFINAPGNVVFEYQTTSGDSSAGFWIPTSNTVTLIPPLPGGVRTVAEGLGDNGTVTLTSEDSNENWEGAKWTTATGTVALGFENSGVDSSVVGSNQAGTAAATDGEDSSQNDTAGESSL
ncbi:hypothetical protein ACFONN_14010 [Dyella humi]|uniref:Ig-like domain-containing protein n=1 Tax=Dyella humi TaxID=1770547 RepID=A0ABW8ILP8_9GAMM